jgi:LPXTG-motif cell wall-anchored protein
MFLLDYVGKKVLIYVGIALIASLGSFLLKRKRSTYQEDINKIINSKEYKVKSQWD